ncbi:sensor histidine kinase [Peribacillus psychrosaccharolyticus]|uniref:Sensor histidine kinase n=2 Tax=Peribacillus psychrosaccharolyticus TaxID=1407 RepID=A0A974NQN6_PERPY|nr:sensor histidine kinase [Peribacillus psychrosaccharolyticus]MED3745047.1 sensor histidine kinase [Peribacillus psychrosaccharolyticus]QQT02346.1 sensor histidine kinase [Peribacillus psychrosaccharolyticus]
MRFIPMRFKHNTLFITISLITFMIIILVSVTITWTTIRMSEQFFFEKFSITNVKIINEIKESFESFHYSIVIASNNILQSGVIKTNLTEEQTNAEKMISFFTMGEYIKQIQSNFDTYEFEIIVKGENGVTLTTNRPHWPITDQELNESFLTSNTLKEPKRLLYQYDERKSETRSIEETRFVVATKALMDRLSGTVYGSLYFSFRESEFKKVYANYTSPGNDIFIVDKSGMIVSSNQSQLIGKKEVDLLRYAQEIKTNSHKYMIGSFRGKEQIILVETLPSLDMYLFNIIDKEKAFGNLIDKRKIVLISIGIVFIALVSVFFVSRRLTNSLSRLVRQIENAPKSEFRQYVAVLGTYETRQIGHAFNSMLDELHEYVEQLMLSQKQKRNAELAALQQQINPHFLYNTLASIKFMVQQDSKEDTEAMITALISLLQNTIGNVNETVTVREELDNLKNYVFINQKRYGNQINVSYLVAPDCLNVRLPKLILQPFMENSFFHGFNRKAGGSIHVLIWQEEDNLICEVVDNGDGIGELTETNLPKYKRQLFSGIGVMNVHERIQLIYGEEYGVTISSKQGEGTKVRIILPSHVEQK